MTEGSLSACAAPTIHARVTRVAKESGGIQMGVFILTRKEVIEAVDHP